MEMVQEQRLKLKMKFLLGYNMKMVVLWGDKKFGGGFFLGERRLSKGRADDEILVK